MTRRDLNLLAALLVVALTFAATVQADKVVKPGAAPSGSWVLIGQTHANHTADHDTIAVRGPFDNFRKVKFKVTDAPLSLSTWW